jgi:hypothetical protein
MDSSRDLDGIEVPKSACVHRTLRKEEPEWGLPGIGWLKSCGIGEINSHRLRPEAAEIAVIDQSNRRGSKVRSLALAAGATPPPMSSGITRQMGLISLSATDHRIPVATRNPEEAPNEWYDDRRRRGEAGV